MVKRQIHTYPFLISISILRMGFFLFPTIVLFSCSPSHILHYKENVSRDYTYIDFARNPDPYEITSSVGGEHIRYIKILGFEGDKFIVTLMPHKGDIQLDISGTGFDTRECQTRMETIFVRDLEAIISLAIHANPYGEYTLNINKL